MHKCNKRESKRMTKPEKHQVSTKQSNMNNLFYAYVLFSYRDTNHLSPNHLFRSFIYSIFKIRIKGKDFYLLKFANVC